MAVKDPMALAARVAVVLGVLLVGVAGLFASLDVDGPLEQLRTLGVATAVIGFVLEAVRAGTPALSLAAVLPAALVAFWLRSTDNVDANVQTGVLVSLAVPFLAVAIRQVVRADESTSGDSWFVGASGAVLVGTGAVTSLLVRSVEQEAVWMLGLGGALLVVYAVADRHLVASVASSRSVVYGSGAWLLVALMGALSVGGYALARRNDHTWDLTRDASFSLSDHAKTVVGAVTEPIAITAYFGAAAPERQAFQDLVDRYVELNPKLSVEWIDPMVQPLRAKQDLVSGDGGTVILKQGERTRRLEGEIVEEELTRELVLVQATVEHSVCWTMGHGEPDPDDEQSDVGFGAARTELEGLNYRVRTVQTAREGVPASCDVVIVARPTEEWFPYEREALVAYVAGGGSAFVLLDAMTLTEFPAELERFGVRVGNDVVLDLDLKSQMLGVDDPSLLVVTPDHRGHPITRSLAASVLLPVARSVRANPEATGVATFDLLRSSPESWGETDPNGPDLGPDQGSETIGEVPLMMAVEITDPASLGVVARTVPPPAEEPVSLPEAPATPEAPVVPDVNDRGRGVPVDYAPKAGGKVVIVGDSDFASTQYLSLGNNLDLFLNSVAWLAEEESQIGERPKPAETLEITLTGEALLCLFSLGVVPGAAVLVAIGTLVRRRYL